MRVVDLTCVESQSATWASCVNTFEGTTVAWTSDGELKSSGATPPPPPKVAGTIFAHLEPQVFLRTQVSGGPRDGNTPLFTTAARGGPLAPLGKISGASIDDAATVSSDVPSSGRPPLIELRGGNLQVFTDVTGDAFGAGPGAVVAATFANASGIDPVVEAFAGGQCATGSYSNPKRGTWQLNPSSLPNGRTVAVYGGLPMLCTGPSLRFLALGLELRSTAGTQVPAAPEVEIGHAAGGLRRTSAFPVLLPLSEASTNAVSGGSSLRFLPQAWLDPAAKQVEIKPSPTHEARDGMTFEISGLPSGVRYGTTQQPVASQAVVLDGTAATCRQIANACGSSSTRSSKPLVCVCDVRDRVGEVVVHFQASSTPRFVGLFADDGGTGLGIYDHASLRVDLS